jgi:hypothetical protein
VFFGMEIGPSGEKAVLVDEAGAAGAFVGGEKLYSALRKLCMNTSPKSSE